MDTLHNLQAPQQFGESLFRQHLSKLLEGKKLGLSEIPSQHTLLLMYAWRKRGPQETVLYHGPHETFELIAA